MHLYRNPHSHRSITLHPHISLIPILRMQTSLARPDADAVMKNPFHTPEMPINSSLFDNRLQGLIGGINA